MSAELQTLLRFLSQDAKVPLATAMGKVKSLQAAGLGTVDAIAKSKLDSVKVIFDDEKVAKQIHSAAKRVSKKRAAGEDARPSPKKQRTGVLFSEQEKSAAEIEALLELPYVEADEDELRSVVFVTNRAPLVLAMAVTLLKYTMPDQPLSSRLSLAQAYVSVSSRSKAVSIGLESGKSAEEEGFGEGQPIVKVMGRGLRVLKRWGYEWKPQTLALSTQETLKAESQDDNSNDKPEEFIVDAEAIQEEPAVWALDLEALKKSNRHAPANANPHNGSQSGLPIHTPQSARAYILKSFETAPSSSHFDSSSKKKQSTAGRVAEKERNLGMLLRALDLLFGSWAGTLTADDLDKRANNWYFKIRPQVENGVAGWGGRNELKLADILALKRDA